MPVVLCIDDDRSGLAFRKLVLETKGYIVLATTSGAAGIQLSRRAHVDAVVLDFQMPNIDGEQVARVLRQEHPTLPIILLSGSEVPASIFPVVNEYLQKGSANSVDLLDRALLRVTQKSLGRAA